MVIAEKIKGARSCTHIQPGLIDTANKPRCATVRLGRIRRALPADCGLLKRTIMATEKHLIYVRLSNQMQFAPGRHRGVQFSNLAAAAALMTPGVVLTTSLCLRAPPATAKAGASVPVSSADKKKASRSRPGLKYQFLLLSFLDRFSWSLA